MAQINSFRDLIVYQKAYKLSLRIFEITKTFPKEEKYSLTDQIRRSSRSVTSNIAEAWAKRIYVKSFVSKLSDSLGEGYETEVWLDYSRDCKYIDDKRHKDLMNGYDEVRKMLISMISNPGKFCKLMITHSSFLATHISPFISHTSSLVWQNLKNVVKKLLIRSRT